MVRLARVVTVAALTIAGTLFTVAPVSAAPTPGINCNPPSSNLLTFTPPLTSTLQPTTIVKQTTYKPCVSQSNPNVISGTSNVTFNMMDDCTMLMLTGSTTFTILWNTGQTSTITATRSPMLVGTPPGSQFVVNFTGTVTAGLWAGLNAKQQFKGSGDDLFNCLYRGGRLQSLKSSVTLAIFP
ncbi:hypothetical protein F4553_000521 [Allocatelliglobosispora scoriae]|uniref:Uncharacterized protein n=1 Tax=Allocatelliglobosispora scoriae TaxID=643052 RepID=A0A841BK44_9ACTN|nr:hypothetical protein [Allocatelliglobosispora scoriae]MBB5867142.1 hypothetical protein [Allocatelliglobosispora scoriae]